MFKKEHNYVHVVKECPPASKVVRIPIPFLRSFEKLLKVSKDQRKLHVQSLDLYKHDIFCLGNFHIAGNALERVQRVHEPADLWDITFCTR